MISSKLHQKIEGFDHVLSETDNDFSSTGLKTTSVIRVGRLAVVESDILVGAIGEIGSARLQTIKARLANWIKEG